MTLLIERHVAWLRARAAHATVVKRQRLLRHASRHLPYGIERACEEEIAAYLGRWTGWSRYTYDSHLRGFYGWAVRAGALTVHPMIDLPKPTSPEPEPRPMADEHTAILLAAPEPIPTVVLLGQLQGLRRAEIVGLCREDITEQTTFIRRAKGGRAEHVPTHPRVWAHLQARPVGEAVTLANGTVVHPVIYGHRGRPLLAESLGALWRKTCRQLGLPDDVKMHQDRHTFGTQLRRSTGDLLLTMKGLRHRNVQTTLIYTDVRSDEVAAAVRALGTPEPVAARLGRPQAA